MKKFFISIVIAALYLVSLNLSAQTCEKNFLSASGNKLYDASGNEVQLTGVNWFGFETAMGFFHGVWARDHKSMLQQIKDQGFNCIRIPWNNQMLTQDITGAINAYGTDPYTGVSPMNEEEATKTTPIEILDITIQWCQDNNLKVILDNHSREPDGYMVEELWYTANVSHEKWIADWVFMANRYKEFDAVIAMDINNEPHGAYGAGSRWGTGNPSNDWRLAAQECGNAILAVHPDVLIMVEGTEEFEETSYWWGGNLQGARNYPVVLSNPAKLVYSPHEYGPTVHLQDWFLDPAFPNNLPDIWETNFNYLHTNGTSPLFFGEFGIRDQGGDDEIWFDAFLNYMVQKGHHWTFWCWNPNSGDTGGLLDDQWKDIVEWKMAKLRPHLAPEIPNCKTSVTIPAEGVTLTPPSVSLVAGTSETLVASVIPSNASNTSVTYASNNLNVATVSTNGTVSAVSAGTATITVTTVDGGFTDSSVITVTEVGISYSLNTTVVGNGAVSLSPAGGVYSEGQIVTATATAASGNVFVSWSGDASGSISEIAITMNSDKNVVATFTADTSGGNQPCTNPTAITLPTSQDGSGEFCFVTADELTIINSWNMDVLEINGVDFTNTWANTFPDKIDGKYYIYYKASVAWAHFEATNLKSTPASFNGLSELKVYPVPADNEIFIDLGTRADVESIELFNSIGQRIHLIENYNIQPIMNIQLLNENAIYILRINTTSEIITKTISTN